MIAANAEQPVVQIIPPRPRRGMLGLGRRGIDLPPAQAGELLFLYRRDGQADAIEPLSRERIAPDALPADAAIVRVCADPRPLELPFAAILTDERSNAWDLSLSGSWRLRDPEAFLLACALQAATPQTPLSADLVASWMIGRLRGGVGDAVRGKEIAYLRDRDGLPPLWWEKRLCDWLAPCGVEVKVSAVRWTSADAEHAAAERKRLAEIERLEAARRQEQSAQLRELEARAFFEREKARLDLDVSTSATETAHRRQLAEMQCRREVLEAQAQVAAAEQDADRARLEHELTMACLRNDLAAANLATERQTRAHQRQQQLASRLAGAHQAIERLRTVPPPIYAPLSGKSSGPGAFQAAERLVSPEFGIPADALAVLGFPVIRQVLVQLLGASAGDGAVTLAKPDLRTRDIGAARVKALPVGRSLRFSLTSRRGGLVTLLNIGTSGAVYVHAPSALAPQARIDPGRECTIPGPELFPWDGDYREEGPPGWEHLAAIVSGAPVIDAAILARSSSESPIVCLSEDEVESLLDRLQDAPAGSWSAGILSFLVGDSGRLP